MKVIHFLFQKENFYRPCFHIIVTLLWIENKTYMDLEHIFINFFNEETLSHWDTLSKSIK